MDERYILAYFNTPEQAENIRKQLAAQEGIIALQVDRIGLYPGSGPDQNVMIAVNPDASGMSDGSDITIRGRDILLTVVVQPEQYDAARNLIRAAGGLI